jgi:hypothetical protein
LSRKSRLKHSVIYDMNPKGFLILFMSVTKKPMRVSPPLRLLGEGNEEENFFPFSGFFHWVNHKGSLHRHVCSWCGWCYLLFLYLYLVFFFFLKNNNFIILNTL